MQDLSDPEVLARIGNRAVKTVNKPSSEYFLIHYSILTSRPRNIENDLVSQSNATIVSGISLKRVAPHLERYPFFVSYCASFVLLFNNCNIDLDYESNRLKLTFGKVSFSASYCFSFVHSFNNCILI